MTDSNQPPSREEFQRLRKAVAAQSEVIEECLPDDPEKRKFLGEAAKGIGAVGALGIAGQSGYVIGEASAEASTSDTDTDIGSPNNRHDVFAEGVDANSVNTDEASHKVSDRTVFADHPDFGEVQDAVNFADTNGYDRVCLTGGGGSGASGEYLVTAGTGGYGVDLAGTNVELTGDEQAVLKLADSQASDYQAVVRLGDNGRLNSVIVDGNKVNQTDGSNDINQCGVHLPTGSIQSDVRIHNLEVRNCQYRGLFLSGFEDLRLDTIYTHDNGHRGLHVEERTGNKANRLTITNVVADNNGGASNAQSIASGIVIGDDIEDIHATGLVATRNAANGIRTEAITGGVISGYAGGNSNVGVKLAAGTGPVQGSFTAFNNTSHGIEISGSGGGCYTMESRSNGGDGVNTDIRLANIQAKCQGNDGAGVRVQGADLGATIVLTAVSNDGDASGDASLRVEGGSAGACDRVVALATTRGASTGASIATNQTNTKLYGAYADGITDNGTGTTTYT